MTPRFALAPITATCLLLATAFPCHAGSPEDAVALTTPCTHEVQDSETATWFVYQAEEDGMLLFITHNSGHDLVIEVYGEDTNGTMLGHCDKDQGHSGNELCAMQVASGDVVYLKVRSYAEEQPLPTFSVTSSFISDATLDTPFLNPADTGEVEPGIIDPGFGGEGPQIIPLNSLQDIQQ